MTKLSNGQIITGFYGQEGVMSDGWDAQEDAQAEFEAFYKNPEYDGCEVIEYNGKWVIAY